MPREIVSIICDDIRFEQGNKISLIGVYTEGILVPRLPITLPKLCLSQTVFDANNIRKIRLVLKGPKLSTSLTAENVDPTKSKMRINISFFPIVFKEEGDYVIETYFDDNPNPTVEKKFYVKIEPGLKLK